MVPIVHDLMEHFKSVELEWLGREENNIADAVAKAASTSKAIRKE